MDHRHDLTRRLHWRGAIATKLVILVALGAGAFWSTQFSPQKPAMPEADVAGVAVSVSDGTRFAVPGPAPEPPIADAPAGDPFAGADVGSNPVLRHIAGIVEPKRTDAATRQSTPAARAPAASSGNGAARGPRALVQAQPAPLAAATGSGTEAPAKRTEDAVSAPPSQAALVQAASTQALPAQVLAPVAPPPVSPVPGASLPATRALPETGKQAVQPNQQVPAPPAAVAARASDAERATLARVDAAPPAPASSVAPPRAISRSVPRFPGEAIKAGIKTGRVLARVTIDADGRVVESQILSATPPGYFEPESQRALASWRYAPPGRSTSTEVELLFARE